MSILTLRTLENMYSIQLLIHLTRREEENRVFFIFKCVTVDFKLSPFCRLQYVPENLLPVYRDKIVPLSDILTPNQYEAE